MRHGRQQKLLTLKPHTEVAFIKSFHKGKMMKDIRIYVALMVVFGVSGLRVYLIV